MKFVKRITALFLAMVMVMAMGINVAAANVNISSHSFNAYQIFSGSMGEGSEIAQVQWGSAISGQNGITADALITALKADATLTSAFSNITTASSAEDVAKVVSGWSNGSNQAKAFAKVVADKITTTTPVAQSFTSNSGTISATGYYLFVDTTDVAGKNDAKNLSLVNCVKENTQVTIETKTEIPNVDKQVLDETADAESGATNGWGETADHAINESFQFKLIATLPADANFANYDTYEVKFSDTMSTGVTFDSIASVKIGNTTVNAGSGKGDYKVDFSAWTDKTQAPYDGDGSKVWTLTIEDIKQVSGVNLTNGATIEVVYNAHLNESAKVTKTTETATTNENTVYLEYSNNPNGSGLGKTEEDHVWVFTYEIDNTKFYKEGQETKYFDQTTGKQVEFKLYSDADCTSEISLIKDSTLGAYRPIKSGETATALVPSTTDGKFNIVGLDAGTYYLKETKTPDGFNPVGTIKVVIAAEHEELTGGTSNKVTFTNTSSNMSNSIENSKGIVLPSTGGMGTTILYVAGVALIVVAGVVVIARKRNA